MEKKMSAEPNPNPGTPGLSPLRGVIPPIVTPLSGRDSLDAAGLERLIEHILSGGVHGLFVLGSSGEAPSLSYRLRYELIDRTCEQVAGRVPVLVGITDTSFTESINTANKAKDSGAAAVVLAAPYYFPSGQAELLEYIEHMVPELPLPLFLYNMPAFTKAAFEPKTVRAAAEIDGIAGIKDSSGDMAYFHQLRSLLKDSPDFSLLVGREELMAEAILLGAHGCVPGGANIIPRLYVDLYDAACSRDLAKIDLLHSRVLEISTSLYRVGHYPSSFLKGIKCALSCMGICGDFLAEPFHRFRRTEREVIRRQLERLGILACE